MNQQHELELLELLKKGKEDAYIFLYRKYSQRLFGYALTLTNDRAMAEDIIQNVFLRIWEHRKKLNITTSVRSYLFKSIYNEFINQYKKKGSTLILEEKYFHLLEEIITEADDQSWEPTLAKIESEINNLPPKCKEIFILSRKEGLTNVEIAAIRNLSVKTIEGHIHKAFMILRAIFGTG